MHTCTKTTGALFLCSPCLGGATRGARWRRKSSGRSSPARGRPRETLLPPPPPPPPRRRRGCGFGKGGPVRPPPSWPRRRRRPLPSPPASSSSWPRRRSWSGRIRTLWWRAWRRRPSAPSLPSFGVGGGLCFQFRTEAFH